MSAITAIVIKPIQGSQLITVTPKAFRLKAVNFATVPIIAKERAKIPLAAVAV